MKKDFPFMPLDYKKLESHEPVKLMNPAQFGCYMRLLISCWHNESLPTDSLALATLSNYRENDFGQAIWPALIPCFYERDGRFFQKTIEEKRAEIIEKHEKLSIAGARGAAIRHKHSQAIARPQARLMPGFSIPKLKAEIKKNDSKVSCSAAVGGFRFFIEKDERIIRNEIAKTLGHAVHSEANTQNFIEVCEEAKKQKGVRNQVAYAIGIARKLK